MSIQQHISSISINLQQQFYLKLIYLNIIVSISISYFLIVLLFNFASRWLGGRNQGTVHYLGMTFGTNHGTILWLAHHGVLQLHFPTVLTCSMSLMDCMGGISMYTTGPGANWDKHWTLVTQGFYPWRQVV